MPSSNAFVGWPRHSARCICRGCRDARRRAEFEGWCAYGPQVVRVYSDEASAHIHLLRRHGWTQGQIARAAGVAESTISNAKVRGTTIDETTHDAILAVQPHQSRR